MILTAHMGAEVFFPANAPDCAYRCQFFPLRVDTTLGYCRTGRRTGRQAGSHKTHFPCKNTHTPYKPWTVACVKVSLNMPLKAGPLTYSLTLFCRSSHSKRALEIDVYYRT